MALTGCSSDPQADYCEVVDAHQAELDEVAASEDAGAVCDALAAESMAAVEQHALDVCGTPLAR